MNLSHDDLSLLDASSSTCKSEMWDHLLLYRQLILNKYLCHKRRSQCSDLVVLFFFLLKTLIFFHLFFPQSLLDEPNPNSPANSQAAQLYQENKREYEKRVTAIVEQSWVDVWASPRRYLLLPLHRPLFFIIPVLQSLIFTSSRKKTATISEELKCHPEKMEE